MHFDIVRLRALFDELIQLPAAQRPAVLEARCQGDNELRRRLEELLATAEDSTSFLSAPTAEAPVQTMLQTAEPTRESAPLREHIGAQVGRYKLLEKIGEGGFGVVYVAEQREPVKRRVALKVIKLGMDTRQVVARFEAERQALAMMDHPNIAKVLDAGATDSGRPYFVMELVRGIRITEYCNQNKLTTKERIELVVQVCNAIQHAHQKGIIHRDIKPSNILVTLHDGVPVPKVIDFGIAKATQQELTEKTVYTQLQQFIGTPAYMSPEQAEMSGLDIDTRSDVYSLGVLLYELLTGKTPFDGKELLSLGIDAMRKAIREKEPLRPSSKVATLQAEELSQTAARHAAEAPKLVRLLRGDLDWIVMRCLEKDRTRRYEAANGLAVDLKRHLNNEPVAARPPSAVYKFQKAFRRNKVAFSAGFAIAAALLLGIIATTLQSVRATHAKEAAVAAQAREAVQRSKAEASEQKAIAAQANEAKLRAQAQAEELIARQRAYASDMNAAAQAFHDNDFGRAQDLLNRERPLPGQSDMREWEWRYLWQQTRSDALFTLCQQPSEINSLAASADGRFLAVGNRYRGGLTVWDLSTRREIAQLVKNDEYVSLAFSPTQPLLAFVGVDTRTGKSLLHFWNAATRQMVLEKQMPEIDGLKFSSDGRKLAISFTGEIILLRIPDGKQLAGYSVPSWNIVDANGFTATPDLSLAAYPYQAFNPQKIAVMDLHTGKQLWNAPASPGFISAAAFSPDGKILATAGAGEADIRLWDVATGKQIGQLEGHTDAVNALVFWPDGKKLASASVDQTIRIWDIASRKCLDVLRGHRDAVLRLALLPDNKTLVSGCQDDTVCLWDTSVTHPREEYITLPEKIITGYNLINSDNQSDLRMANLSFAPDSQSVLTLTNGEVARWTGPEFQNKELLLTNMPRDYDRGGFAEDGRFFISASRNNFISIWNISTQTLWRQFKAPPAGDLLDDVALLDNGNELITLSPGRFHEWDLATGSQIRSWPVPTGPQCITAFSPDEQWCITIDPAGEIGARKLGDKKTLLLPMYVEGACGAAFSPDGKFFAVARGKFRCVQVWDTKTWRELATLRMVNAAFSVAFSPDGKLLAAGGVDDEEVTLWDTDNWQEIGNLPGSGEAYQGPLFSADGNCIGVLSDDDHTVQVWRAPSWAQIHAVEAKSSPLAGGGAGGGMETSSSVPAVIAPDWQLALTKAGFTFKAQLLPDGTWYVYLNNQPISDLSILRGVPISDLWLQFTAVSDLTPLRGMPLKHLLLTADKVSDLSPLAGMALQALNITATRVSDISVLHGMPLVYLQMEECPKIMDFSPLKGMKALEKLELPRQAKGIDFLRSFPKLKRIGYKYDPAVIGPDQTAAEFWKAYDKAHGKEGTTRARGDTK